MSKIFDIFNMTLKLFPTITHIGRYGNPREGVEVGSSDKLSLLFLTTTHVGRFGICFFCVSFGFGIFHIYNQSGDDFMPKISWANILKSFLGRCQSGQ